MKNEEIDNELLICDMSLEIGDSFTTPVFYNLMWDDNYYENIIVYDIKIENGKKIIDFVYFDEELVVYTFTEGIFPPIMPEISYGENNVLTCQYKDGEHVYLWPYSLECLSECSLSTNDIFDDKALTISPTIFSNSETISIKADSDIKSIKMIDMLGRKINIFINPTDDLSCQISLDQRCKSGIYLIIVETEKSVCYEKVILCD